MATAARTGMRSKSRPRARQLVALASFVVGVSTIQAGGVDRPVVAAQIAPTRAARPARTALASIATTSPVPQTVVTGSIVDGAGHPIVGVRVGIGDASADSDARGEFGVAASVAATHTLVFDGPQIFPAEVTWRAGDPAPRILLARRERIAARVTANGVPVVGAEVSLSDGSGPTLATATTDREGIARFEDLLPGPYELWARRETQVSSLARVADIGGELASDVALELAPGGSISGRVVTDDKPPAGATVVVSPLDVDHAMRVATIDAEGRFTIDGVPRGRWRIDGEAGGYVQSGDPIVELHGQHEDIAVRMLRAGVVSGTAVDGAGTPVANATILLREQGVRQQGTQAARIAERSSAMSSARLRWVHPLAGRRTLPSGDALRFGAPRPGVRPAECGGGHCGVDLGHERGTIIHAAADGEIALAFTEIRGEAGRYIAIDHGDGLRTFYMHLDELRGGLEIGQKVRAGDPLGKMGSTGFAEGPHLHFAITQERDGRTWYIDPEPILRHAVVLPAARALDPIDGTTTVIAAVRRGELGDSARPAVPARTLTTDARGRFRIESVAPGTYVAVAVAEDLAPATSSTFAVRTASETGDIAITLHPGVVVQGRIIGRDGPIAGARVVATAGTGENTHDVASAYATDRGDYALRALSGPITLSVTAPGYGVFERPIVLDGGAVNRPRHREDFVLVIENAQLRGQVLAPDGGPAGAVALRVVDGPTHRNVVTDAVGRFTIDHVASGSYVLEAASAEYPVARMTLTTAAFAELRLERGGSVRCDVRDTRTNEPLDGVRVDAIGSGAQVISIVSDARGIVDLHALPLGEWTVRARAKGYTETRQVVTVRAAVPSELHLELSRGVTLAGVVRDRYGRRAAGARVWTDGVSTQTDADGNFRIGDAPAGTHWLEAELAGAKGAVQVQLVAGDERLALAIELRGN